MIYKINLTKKEANTLAYCLVSDAQNESSSDIADMYYKLINALEQ